MFALCFLLDFSLKNLTELKYLDIDGQPQCLRLKEELSKEWQTMGDLLGIRVAQLDAIEKQHCNPMEHCRKVLSTWMELGGDDYYPSWEGLMKLLDGLKLKKTLKDLKLALSKYTR